MFSIDKKIFLLLLIHCISIIKPNCSFSQNFDEAKIAFELCKIYSNDQLVRDTVLYKNCGKGIIDIITYVDSVNFAQLIEIIKVFGYPNKKSFSKAYVDECVLMAPRVVFLHNPKKVIEPSIYNLLRDEVHKGNLAPEEFAVFLDKYYVMFEGRSLFNTPFKQWTRSKGVKKKDKKDSDRERNKIGLPPLEDSVYVE